MLMDINEFKRNPAVKFNYSYFVDQEPTKYVGGASEVTRVVHAKNEEIKSEEQTKKGINKTTAIMMGAIAGVAVLAIVITSIFLAFGKKKVEVPNFLNMNFYETIDGNTEYDNFEFKLEFDESSALPDGTVLNQDPSPSERVKNGSQITLTIAKKDSVVIDVSIIGKSEDDAKDMLIKSGLLPTVIPEYSNKVEPGTVIRTSPQAGSTVKINSEVTIYIATDKQETVLVPPLLNCTREEAETLLKASGLEVGTVKEVDSEIEKGKVVSQSIEKDTAVPVGSRIDFTISTGVPSESSVDITVKLPSVQRTGIVKIFINNELFYTSSELYLDGASKTYTLKGKGADNVYTVTVDGVQIQKGKVDFTKVPAVVSDVEDIPFDTTAVMVDVVNKPKADAIKILNNAGFKNIEIVEQSSNTVEAGKVISQTPSSGTVSTSTKIVLVVSTGPEA